MKPIKFLLANNTLSYLAGSETWTYTLAVALRRMGHEVECFSPELGIISRELEKEGISSLDAILNSGVKPFSIVLEEERSYDYDVIIANHNHIVDFLRAKFPKTPIISTIHGIMHWMQNKKNGEQVMAPEHPALNARVDQFISVSEEVQDMLRKDYGLDSRIIRNFLDIKRFDAVRQISPAPKKIAVNTNYADKNDPEISVLREVAKHYDATLLAIGQNFSQTFDTMKIIEDADIVVGMGRSVIEGICAGRLGIVHGRWGTAGVVRESNIDMIRRCNFSGRNSGGRFMTAEELIKEIDTFYIPSTIDWGKRYMRVEHNAVFAAQSFVQIARELIEGNKTTIATAVDPVARPFRRQSDVVQTTS